MENKLQQQILNETDLLQLLHLSKKQLDYLRWHKGFPVVKLSSNARIYIIDDVLRYIKHLSINRK